MKLNLIVKRRDVKRQIDEDPWACTCYRRGRTPDDAETSWTFTARVYPEGTRGSQLLNPLAMPGEGARTKFGWLLLIEHGVTPPREGDELRVVQDSTGYEKALTVYTNQRFGYKQEISCDERQK